MQRRKSTDCRMVRQGCSWHDLSVHWICKGIALEQKWRLCAQDSQNVQHVCWKTCLPVLVRKCELRQCFDTWSGNMSVDSIGLSVYNCTSELHGWSGTSVCSRYLHFSLHFCRIHSDLVYWPRQSLLLSLGPLALRVECDWSVSQRRNSISSLSFTLQVPHALVFSTLFRAYFLSFCL